MKRFRPLLTTLLGLMFWVQGMAIAATPVDLPVADEAQSAMEMPCHGDSTDVPPCDCCDGDCPDMASCAVGHFFTAPSTMASFAPAAHAAVAATGWSLKTAVLPLPVRPPITVHA